MSAPVLSATWGADLRIVLVSFFVASFVAMPAEIIVTRLGASLWLALVTFWPAYVGIVFTMARALAAARVFPQPQEEK